MIVSGNYSQVQLNYQPFWEKPPLFIWLQAFSMQLFGINEFAARFPNAVCSVISFISMYHIGKRFHSGRFGLVWCFVYASAILPHLYFKSGIIDPWFNLFIILSLYHLILFFNNAESKSLWHPLLSGLFLGLAVLTKGPAAIVIIGVTFLFMSVWNRKGALFKKTSFLVFVLTALLVSCSWFIVQWIKGNGDIVREFITYQMRLFQTGDSGHDGPFYYHVLVLLLGCFPASFLFIAAYKYSSSLTPFQMLFRRFFITLFWVVLILFSVVKTKIVHYSSLCYFPLTLIASLGLVQFFDQLKMRGMNRNLFWLTTAVFTVAFTAAGFAPKLVEFMLSQGWIQDEFARENLKAEVSWSGYESLLGLLFLAGALLIYRGITRHRMRLVYYGLAVNLLFIWLAVVVIIPKVELYTQHAAIAFYKAVAPQKCYLETHSFKSYAYLFYGQRKPSDYTNPEQIKTIDEILDDSERSGHTRYTFFALANCYWIEHGKIDRPAYIVSRINQEPEVAAIPGFRKLYSLNGFSFFVRMPQ